MLVKTHQLACRVGPNNGWAGCNRISDHVCWVGSSKIFEVPPFGKGALPLGYVMLKPYPLTQIS